MSGGAADLRPESPEEQVLWHCIVWTYAYYLLGALYVLAPVVGWTLLLRQARRQGLAEVPPAAWSWVGGMGLMLVSLIAGHADFGLGLGALVKSSIGWAKGWGLMAVFVLIGCGRVRLAVLARAVNLLGLQTLAILPLLALAWAAGLPGQLYVSPVSVVGGPGPEFFEVLLYGISPDSGAPRWWLFAPWAPAIGLVMSAYALIGWNDPDRRLRALGLTGMLLAIVLSGSRLGLLALPLTLGAMALLRRIGRPSLYLAASPLALLGALIVQPLSELAEQALESFHGARADSSRVRATLGRIAVDRWQQEAWLWGHGTVERGPHLVEYMPIGSHHSWYGLLFVKGVVGVLGLALPMAWTLGALLGRGGASATGRTALGLLLLLFVYTFAENLEILAYLYWPALVVLGLALREAHGLRATGRAAAGEPANASLQSGDNCEAVRG